MKIRFKMPIDIQGKWHVSYSVKTDWCNDGKKIGEILTLKIEIDSRTSRGNLDPVQRESLAVFDAVTVANPDLIEASIKIPMHPHENCVLTFCKHGEFSKQDADDCEIIHWLPDDPIEWAQGE